jgi:hypothetical protein
VSTGFERVRRLPAVVIGPRTAAAARAEGFERVVVADEPTVAALAGAVVAAVPAASVVPAVPAASVAPAGGFAPRRGSATIPEDGR